MRYGIVSSALVATSVLTVPSYADVLRKESFEGCTGTGYALESGSFGGNSDDYIRCGSNVSGGFAFASGALSGHDGTDFIGLEDIVGAGFANPNAVVLTAVDITGATNLKVSFLFAAPNPANTRYETSDYLRLEYSVDGGSFITVGSFRGTGAIGMAEDPNLTGSFTVPVNGTTMQRFTYTLNNRAGQGTVSGSSLQVRVAFSSDGSHEEMAFDDIVVEGTVVTPQCGDTICNGSETTATCPADCGSQCGDTVCNGTESTANCVADCGSQCGDTVCNGTESTANCVADCGSQCGDTVCNGTESTANCVADCGSQCGDGVINGAEVCDGNVLSGQTCSSQNFDFGTLGCANDCLSFDTSACANNVCGDGVIFGGEQCDDGSGNSDSMPNACRTTCTIADCGDSVVDTGEVCDGANLNGESCGSLGFASGVLSCGIGCGEFVLVDCEPYETVDAGPDDGGLEDAGPDADVSEDAETSDVSSSTAATSETSTTSVGTTSSESTVTSDDQSTSGVITSDDDSTSGVLTLDDDSTSDVLTSEDDNTLTSDDESTTDERHSSDDGTTGVVTSDDGSTNGVNTSSDDRTPGATTSEDERTSGLLTSGNDSMGSGVTSDDGTTGSALTSDRTDTDSDSRSTAVTDSFALDGGADGGLGGGTGAGGCDCRIGAHQRSEGARWLGLLLVGLAFGRLRQRRGAANSAR